MKRLVPLLAVTLILCGCSGGSAGKGKDVPVTAAGPASAQTAEVDGQESLRFSPNVVNAKVGKLLLTVGNRGGTPHNLVFDDAALPKTRTIDGGSSQVLTLTFSTPGTFAFQCTLHPGMTGKVVVS